MTPPDHPSEPEPEPDADTGLHDIEADIDQTREQFGETIDALATNLKAQAKSTVTEAKNNVVAFRSKPAFPVIIAGSAAMVAVLVAARRRPR